ncbi:MAG: hypothetical protein DHS20C12_13580 [Pseudohongiella sp.]|nr:MAG: hypothetical protein DHS20C12_13580 [Pseudohongiella sp.]
MGLFSYMQEMWQLAAQGEDQGILFWVALYLFVVCAYSLVFQLRTRYWPSTQGELVDLEIDKFGLTESNLSDQDYIIDALYKYTVSGVEYEGTRISPWIFSVSHNGKILLRKQMSYIQRFPDGKVKVFYNPSRPKKSFLIIAGKVGICITLAICVLPLILFFYKYGV